VRRKSTQNDGVAIVQERVLVTVRQPQRLLATFDEFPSERLLGQWARKRSTSKSPEPGCSR
jgi:hypothetical protein